MARGGHWRSVLSIAPRGAEAIQRDVRRRPEEAAGRLDQPPVDSNSNRRPADPDSEPGQQAPESPHTCTHVRSTGPLARGCLIFWGEAYLSIENTLNGNRPRRSIDPSGAGSAPTEPSQADVCVHSDHCGGSWPKTSAAVTSRAMVGPAPRARPPLDTRKDSHWHEHSTASRPPLRLHAR